MFEDLMVAGQVPGKQQAGSPASAPRQPAPAALEQEPVELSEAATQLVERLKRGEPFVLRGVTFEYEKRALRPESDAVLENLGELLRAYPDLVVAVIAHTDNMGDPDELQTMSLQQAEAIRGVLTEKHGAAAAQVVVRGRGGAEPLLPNINRRNRQINRRIELQLVTAPGGGW